MKARLHKLLQRTISSCNRKFQQYMRKYRLSILGTLISITIVMSDVCYTLEYKKPSCCMHKPLRTGDAVCKNLFCIDSIPQAKIVTNRGAPNSNRSRVFPVSHFSNCTGNIDRYMRQSRKDMIDKDTMTFYW